MRETAAGAGTPAAAEGEAPVRLLLVFNSFAFVLSHFLPVVEGSVAAGFEVHVAAPPDPVAEARLARPGVRLHRLGIDRHGTNPLMEIVSLRAIWQLFQQLRPDIVHLATIKPVLYGGIAARLAGVPAVLSAFTGLGYVFIGSTWKSRLLRRVLGPLYRAALGHPRQKVMFENAADRAAIEALGVDLADKAEMTPGYGIDLETFAPTPEPDGPVRVLMPARVLTDKGVREFVEAAQTLRCEGVEARFAVAGDAPAGNPASVPDKILEAWRAEGVVELLGFRSDMPQVLAASHIIALPSYREGFPRALVEAAAAARPVVTTDVPGCRDAIVQGETGLLVPARDSAALARAIRRLIEEPETRRRMGRAGRALAERDYSAAMIVGRLMALYRALAAKQD